MKIGIITHYYNSNNYGGNLQAYALCNVIRKLGYSAEQIQYDRKSENRFLGYKKIPLRIIYDKIKSRIKNKVNSMVYGKKYEDGLRLRNKAIRTFNKQSIPHSEQVYNTDTIAQANISYDVFITGSDQVWHPEAVCGAYLLNFVDGNVRTKLSYAASLAVNNISQNYEYLLKEALVDFQAVSVREQSAVDIINRVTGSIVEQVLDPTLLLDSSEWDEIVPKSPISGKYIFCYFLGGSHNHRQIAKAYAEKYSIKLVTLPYLQGKYQKHDEDFGDIQLYDIDPPLFISLIKHAEYVFTDSFHATVFSILYRKQFVVLERASGNGSMGSRLYTLTEIFGVKERFCDTTEKESFKYIDSLSLIDYDRDFLEFEDLKKASIMFLENNLRIAEGKL